MVGWKFDFLVGVLLIVFVWGSYVEGITFKLNFKSMLKNYLPFKRWLLIEFSRYFTFYVKLASELLFSSILIWSSCIFSFNFFTTN